MANAAPILFNQAQTRFDFVTPFNQSPPDPIDILFANLPANPVGPGYLTISAIGDFQPGDTESFGVAADDGLMDFGILYNNNPADDLFDNSFFGDSGIGSLSTGTIPTTAMIDPTTLAELVSDGMINFRITFGATVGDRPQERMTLTLQYDYEPPPAPVPEPATLLLVGTGAVGLLARRRRAIRTALAMLHAKAAQ